jgi:molybdopterin-guanine dinucleotide biosynthesis protein A
MGRPKHELPVAGMTLIEWVARRLAPAFDEVLVVSRDGAVKAPGASALADVRPGAGPLAGIECGLQHARHARVVAMACDMPYVTAEFARFLVAALDQYDAAVPRIETRAEPVCAAYDRGALAVISACLDSGERRAKAALDRLHVRYVDSTELAIAGFGGEMLRSLNTPDDYERFREAL